VLVVGGVPRALIATGAAGRRAGFDRCADDPEIGRRLAGENAAGSLADVGAVEVETNATDQLLHVVLAETGVGAACAGSGTVQALVDTTQKRVAIKAGRLWMRLDDLLNCHVLSLLVREALDLIMRHDPADGSLRGISRTLPRHPTSGTVAGYQLTPSR
jgi:hypothetical protein